MQFKLSKIQDGFDQLKTEYEELKNKTQNDVFVFLTKIFLVLFKLNIAQSHSICQTLIEYTIEHIETNLDAYKIIQLSILSVCYWKERKFHEALNCMSLELKLVTHSNDLHNKYRILGEFYFIASDQTLIILLKLFIISPGNIANAQKLLKSYVKSKAYFKEQLNVSLEIKNRFLTITALNSLGSIHMQCKEFEAALGCFNKSLILIKKFQETTNIKSDLLVKQYFFLGDCYLKLNMLIKSRDIFREQLNLLSSLLSSKDHGQSENNENYYLEISKTQLNLGMDASQFRYLDLKQ
jgi:tetratricopeptide (TPR) repeat protein